MKEFILNVKTVDAAKERRKKMTSLKYIHITFLLEKRLFFSFFSKFEKIKCTSNHKCRLHVTFALRLIVRYKRIKLQTKLHEKFIHKNQ